MAAAINGPNDSSYNLIWCGADLGTCRIYPCRAVSYKDQTEDVPVPESPKRILGLDPGVDNFLTITTNFPAEPLVIDGKWIKSENQGFNRSRARLMSELTKGLDSTKSVKNSKRLNAISRKREHQFRDFFYKTAHYIAKFCVENQVEVIVYGHNKRQKQNADIGKSGNQNFVSIPYQTFYTILTHVATKYRLPVMSQEESYTSKASLIDNDPIPVYGKEQGTPVFSGKRISRGQYRTKDGTILNADVTKYIAANYFKTCIHVRL